MRRFTRRNHTAINAFQWDENNIATELPSSIEKWPNTGGVLLEVHPTEGLRLCLSTLEGVMVAYPGDWIITGVMGELYSCKPDIFQVLYEPCI